MPRLTPTYAGSPWPQWIDLTNQTNVGTPTITWTAWTSNITVTQTCDWYPVQASTVWPAWNITYNNAYGDFARMPVYEPASQREAGPVLTRARSMLESVLTVEQKKELADHGRIHLRGSKGRPYCIRARGQSGNVQLLDDDGVETAILCAHPAGNLPNPDAWLAQLLALEADEDHFLRTANVHRGRLPAGIR